MRPRLVVRLGMVGQELDSTKCFVQDPTAGWHASPNCVREGVSFCYSEPSSSPTPIGGVPILVVTDMAPLQLPLGILSILSLVLRNTSSPSPFSHSCSAHLSLVPSHFHYSPGPHHIRQQSPFIRTLT